MERWKTWVVLPKMPPQAGGGDNMNCESCQWYDEVNEICDNPESEAYETPVDETAVCDKYEAWLF